MMDSEMSQTLNMSTDVEMSKEENSEKDSGIEEVSPQHKTLSFTEESDSEDDFCAKFSRKQTAVIVDDDDDSDGDDNAAVTDNNNNHRNTVREPVRNVLLPDIEYGSLEILENENIETDDDDDDDDDDDKKFNIIKRKKTSSQKKAKDSFHDNVFSNSHEKNSDSSGDEIGQKEDSDMGSDSNGDDDDEGFSAIKLTAKLKAKLKKGATKQPRKERASKTKAKNDLLELHSETQRLIRESNVNLPYHQPVSKSLNVFLNRAARKQQQYRALHSCAANEKLKVKFVQDTIENDSVMFKSVSYAENIDSLLKETESVDDSNEASEQSKTTDGSVSCQGVSSLSFTGIKDLEPSVNNKQGEKSIDCDDGDELDELPSLFVRAKNLLSKNTEDDSNHLPDIPVDSENISFDHSQTLVDKVVEEEEECNNNNGDGIDDGCKDSNVNREQIASSSKPMDSSTNNNSGWVVDSNGMMQTDDSFMDELLCSDLNSQAQTAYTPSLQIQTQAPLSAELVATTTTTPLPPTAAAAVVTTKSQATESSLDTEIVPSRRETSQKSMKRCLPLELLDPDVCSFTPKLSGSLTQAINLDDEDEVEQPHGTDLLMQRLLKSTNVNKGRKQNTEVNISIVEKECDDNQKENLKLSTVTYHMDTELSQQNELQLDKPGSKLMALKNHLVKQIWIKRGENRKKRCDLYKLDNEEVYDNLKDDEEEAELTDGSDSVDSETEDKGEEEEGDEEYDDDEEEEMLSYKEKRKPKNAFVDEEAEEEDDYEGEDEDDDDDEEGDREQFEKEPKIKNNNDNDSADDSFDFNLDQSDEDSDVPISQNLSKKRKARLEEDDDDNDDDADEKTNIMNDHFVIKKPNDSGKPLFPKTPSDVSCKSLNISAEDTQDLYKSFGDFQSPEMDSNSLKFPIDSQASPMLDEQGFLRVKSLGVTTHQPKRSALDSLCDTQDNMDDVIGLCSGQFAEAAEERTKSCRTLFNDSINFNSQFPLSGKFSWNKKPENKYFSVDGDGEGFGTLKLLSDDEDSNRGSGKEDDNDTDVLNESDDDDDNGFNVGGGGGDDDASIDDVNSEKEEDENGSTQKFSGFTYGNTSRKIRREFLEDEAELSGSEYDSDENDNLDDEFDVMEEEEGDKDITLDNDELRNQVGRVHLKNMIDDDKREVMKLQEMYLPDGDLYSEGAGRKRQFRWKYIDENSQQDMFHHESDKEENEEEEGDDLKWRVERHNREKWLAENAPEKTETDSQFLKFGQVFVKQKGKQLDKKNSESKIVTKVPNRTVARSRSLTTKGSFLNRSNDCLAKIAELTKPASNPTIGNKVNGRNFVFSVVNPEETSTPGPKSVKNKANTTPNTQPTKKQKVEVVKRSFSASSVFHHID
ncbi:claspin-like [Octopus sinensis]|uniref:Claspin-like n=1 Tax=Octopus sinensis TaxID=2607531 RepID=A0A6P7SZS7_9MOLL|nr:claspin-like [Octopus sinensis]